MPEMPRCAVGVPNVGPFGDPLLLVDLAVAAEEHGWDGFFVWDHLLYQDPSWHVADPLVVITAVAARTARIKIAVMVNVLARRRVGKVARESVTLDALSGGRLIVGAGLGSLPAEFTAFGESGDPKVRAARMDESLQLLDTLGTGQPVTFYGEHLSAQGVTMLPRPQQRPRIPIWCGGRWPNKAPFRRAARWDGVMPTHLRYGLGETMPPEDLRAAVEFTLEHRTAGGPFDVALEGHTDGATADRGGQHLVRYAQAGLTWWIEALGWWRGAPADAMVRVRQGPPVFPAELPPRPPSRRRVATRTGTARASGWRRGRAARRSPRRGAALHG
jgi:alkanesulfonate monooxygenase SsuD/methylene tetrahydromethanopterin reductase-like flavin-dependent oxidoreductase (luciferase family)